MLIKDPKVLEEICTALQIQIPPDNVGKTTYYLNFYCGSLNSEDVQNSEDHGWGIYWECTRKSII